MNCPKCGGNDIQIVQGNGKSRTGGGILTGFINIILGIFTCGIWFLLLRVKRFIFGKKTKTKNDILGVCMTCGNKFKI